MKLPLLRFLAVAALSGALGWETSCVISRRNAFSAMVSTAAATLPFGVAPPAVADGQIPFENRDRKSNKGAVIREDYWYMMGSTPPRLLSAPLKEDAPQWNAFGSCTSSETGGNSCTYVSLSQRIPAYSKYGFSISFGAKEYQKLGGILSSLASQPKSADLWEKAASFVTTEQGSIPPAVVDAELKAVLLATALMISPNFPKPSRQLLVARFYVNEAHFASQEMGNAIANRDIGRAMEAWRFGRDSWNSYFQVVNTSISPKVGDKFEAIA